MSALLDGLLLESAGEKSRGKDGKPHPLPICNGKRVTDTSFLCLYNGSDVTDTFLYASLTVTMSPIKNFFCLCYSNEVIVT